MRKTTWDWDIIGNATGISAVKQGGIIGGNLIGKTNGVSLTI